jgi:23S rRNA pseudouridine2605 synthase
LREQIEIHAVYGDSAMRLAKFLATAGIASRRAAETIVRSGRVTVDGEPITDPARGVEPGDDVRLDGEPVQAASELAIYAVNKPAAVVSTASDPQGRRTVVSLVHSDLRLYPVGRLDIDTTGLILLTNDGALAYQLMHPSFEVPKTYRAALWGPPVSDAAVRALRRGVELEDGVTAPARVRKVGPSTLELTIHEGRKRQVKRMCEHVGHRVRRLERVSFGPLELGDLKPGDHRRLTADEVRALTSAATAGRRGAA